MVDRSFSKDVTENVAEDLECLNGYRFRVGNDLQGLIQAFIGESKHKRQGYKCVLRSLCTQIIINTIRQESEEESPSPHRRADSSANMKNVLDHMERCYCNRFSLAEVARLANLSPFYFIRVFKAHTGKTPYEYLLDLRIEKAKRMLAAEKTAGYRSSRPLRLQ